MDNDRLKRVFDQVKPSREQEEAMLAQLLSGEKEVRPMRRSRKLTVVMAVIAALLLTAVALAVATVLDPAFLEHFGAKPKDEELLGKAAFDVNMTARSHEVLKVGDGYTVGAPLGEGDEDIGTLSIRQAVVDRYSARFLIDYTAPEGVVLDEDYYLPGSWSFTLRGEEDWDILPFSWMTKWDMVEDEDPADNHITMLLTLLPMDSGGELLGRRLTVTFHNLYTAESWEAVRRTGERTTVVEGFWIFEIINLPEEDFGIYYPINQPVNIGESSVTLESIYVSPISLDCDMKNGENVLIMMDDTRWTAWEEGVALLTKRGKRIPVIDAFQPVTGSGSFGTGLFYYRPERIIDPAEITAVEFFGQTISLK